SDASSGTRDAEWWVRSPFTVGDAAPCIRLEAAAFETAAGRHVVDGVEGFPGKIALRWHVRSWPGAPENQRLVTLTLVNESQIGEAAIDSLCLFQSGIVVDAPPGAIGVYPQATLVVQEANDPLDDERVNRVIYSGRAVRAVGHGCAVDWEDSGTALWTDVMPAWEMSPMDFDVKDVEGNPLRLPMRVFAEMDGPDHDAFRLVDGLVSSYEKWISELRPDCFPNLRDTADGLVLRCGQAAARMREGLDLLKGRDGTARRAFALANRAMLMAQHRRSGEARVPEFKSDQQAAIRRQQGSRNRVRPAPELVGWKRDYAALDLESDEVKAAERRIDRPIGQWRPFQLAFLLMSIEGIVHGDSDDRQIVDLIWFPTGGGKTEAYLGLTAFTVFFNVLSGRVNKEANECRAVSILMRYTLRLLTAQQFERAVKLFCAMELIRKEENSGLGNAPFSVGLWVGGSNTPNRVDYQSDDAPGAVQSKKKLEKDSGARNPFVLLQCPWCDARFGHVAEGVVHGYRIAGKGVGATFEYVCPDGRCEFGPGHHLRIPAQVVDENLYREPPTLLIGTVDKFAMLAWTPEARSFFGIGNDGTRQADGPVLIIQDEMHLMTGPLGTMVGLFETAVDALCRYAKEQDPQVIA
ncbi:MAG: hypothetical protein LOX97_06675, partial [Sphingomonas sp.]|nr:hypothetical protein [Sphingomonas sp.]